MGKMDIKPLILKGQKHKLVPNLVAYLTDFKVAAGQIIMNFHKMDSSFDSFYITVGSDRMKIPFKKIGKKYLVNIGDVLNNNYIHGNYKIYAKKGRISYKILLKNNVFDDVNNNWYLDNHNSKSWIYISKKNELSVKVDVLGNDISTDLPNLDLKEVQVEGNTLKLTFFNKGVNIDDVVIGPFNDDMSPVGFNVIFEDTFLQLHLNILEIQHIVEEATLSDSLSNKSLYVFIKSGDGLVSIGGNTKKYNISNIADKLISSVNLSVKDGLCILNIIYTKKSYSFKNIEIINDNVFTVTGVKADDVKSIFFKGRDTHQMIEIKDFTFTDSKLKIDLRHDNWISQYYDLYVKGSDGYWHMLVLDHKKSNIMSDNMFLMNLDLFGRSYVYYTASNKLAVTINSLPKAVIASKRVETSTKVYSKKNQLIIDGNKKIDNLYAYNPKSNEGMYLDPENFQNNILGKEYSFYSWELYLKYVGEEYNKVQNEISKKDKVVFSIVIINYNNDFNLRKLFNSLNKQQLDFNQVEIIFVDNNSVDNSRNIVSETFEKLINFKKIYISSNEGPGAARNKGIQAAVGEYITFIDSDDVIPTGIYNNMLNLAKVNNSDVITGTPQHRKGKKEWISSMYATTFVANRKNISLNEYPELVYDLTVWNKIYRLSYLTDNHILFPEDRLYEDVEFALNVFSKSNNITVVSNENVYWWQVNTHIGKQSITHDRIDLTNMGDRMKVIINALMLLRNQPQAFATYSDKVEKLDFKLYDDAASNATKKYNEVYEQYKNKIREIIMQKG